MDDEQCICPECVDDGYIRCLIQDTGNNEYPCAYCHGDGLTLALDEIADRMHEVFNNCYSSYQGDFYRGGSSAVEIISLTLGVEEEVYNDIFKILCDKHNDYYDSDVYSDDYLYLRTVYSVGEYDHTWNKLKKSLRTKTRFFNDDLRAFLDSMFSGIETMNLETGATVRLLDESHLMYRARVFEDYREVEAALAHPARNFGPPPSALATSGRMNAYGVPVFYGAASRETAIAEVRPAVGSLVVVAQFVPLRTLHMLDLSGLERLVDNNGSLFDPVTQHRFEVTSFLRTLAHKLTIPVFGKSKESQYLITQAVAEYLSLSETPNLDGIMFHSTQSENPEQKEEKDYNVVLFSKSSRVKNAHESAPKYDVRMYENIEEDMYGIAPVIYPAEEKAGKDSHVSRYSPSSGQDTLELCAGGIEIHKVQALQFKCIATHVDLGKKISPHKKSNGGA